MRQVKTRFWLLGIPALIAGCAPDNTPKTEVSIEPLTLAGLKVDIEGVLEYGSTVFAENPTTLLEANDFHGYEFDGRTGGTVTISMTGSMTGSTCGATDTLLYLFGPEDVNGSRGASLIENDDALIAPCFLDSKIANFRLPTDGTYLIVATSFQQKGGGANGHYKLSLTCTNNACALPGSPTLASTRIAQTDIDAGRLTPDDLFEIGDFLFGVAYQTKDGMGNALTAAPGNNTPRPNFRPFPNNVHFAAFGAPEAQSCVSCHNVGGDNGAGDLNHNIFQIGDGINRSSGVPRNPPSLLGSGLRQRIGEEMTAELQGQLAAGKTQALWPSPHDVIVMLRSKNINFGSVVAKANGTVDFTNLSKGIDPDLVVKPFGWKGSEATLRRFIEGSFRVHFGLQTESSVALGCTGSDITLGNGPNCLDPDNDGVTKEISDGQLSAEAAYIGMLQVPGRIPAANPTAQNRVNQGENLFNQVFCGNCHRKNMAINNPVHIERGDTTAGPGISINVATDTHDSYPAADAAVEIWSDFRRHDMSPSDCDSKAFGQVGACFFMTPPLWGVRETGPWLHDGRAATLLDAILMHGDGEGKFSVDAFKALPADDQQKLVEFLLSLSRGGNVSGIPTCQPAPEDTANFLPASDCQRTTCGLNGAWLGDGVPFRTLHLTHLKPNKPNTENPNTENQLNIVKFVNNQNSPMLTDVQGDILFGKDTITNSGTKASAGWRLYLADRPPSSSTGLSISRYELKIESITDTDTVEFWTRLTDADHADKFRTYKFKATDLLNKCIFNLCKPNLVNNSDSSGITGSAVIFRGDFYDNKYNVKDSPSDLYDSDLFNIACVDTAIAKLHRFRHTVASGNITTITQRQTMLRLLTADYCGIGHPFTEDGLPIKLGFDLPGYTVTSSSGYALSPTNSLDALWNANGANCIAHPRWANHEGWTELSLRGEIDRACTDAGKPRIPDCLPISSVPTVPPFVISPHTGCAISATP